MKKYCAIVLCVLALTTVSAQRYAGFKQMIVKNKEGKVGFANYDEKKEKGVGDRLLVPYQFDHATDYSDSGYSAVLVNGKWGMIDTLGRMLVPAAYEHVVPFSNGMAIVFQNGLYGAVNKQGQLTVPVVYDRINLFNAEGKASAVKNGKWGVITTNNTEFIPFFYDRIVNAFGFFSLYDGTSWICLNSKGERFADYIEMRRFDRNQVIAYDKDSRKFLVNEKGERLISEPINNFWPRKGKDVIVVQMPDKKKGAFNTATAQWVLQPVYHTVDISSTDKILVAEFETTGPVFFTDINGKRLFNKELEDADTLNPKGWAFAMPKEKEVWGIINEQGKWILEPDLDAEVPGYTLLNGYIGIHKDGKWGLLNAQLKTVLPAVYLPLPSSKTPFDNSYNGYSLFRHATTGQQGVTDLEGKWLIAPGVYDSLGALRVSTLDRTGYIVTWKNGKAGLYDLVNNKELLPNNYRNIIDLYSYRKMEVIGNDGSKGLVILPEGKVLLSPLYDHYDHIEKTGQSIIKLGKKYGLVENNSIILRPEYDAVAYSGEMSWYMTVKDGKVNFVDTKGQVKLSTNYPPSYGRADADGVRYPYTGGFSNYVAMVNNGSEDVLININGEIVTRASSFRHTQKPSYMIRHQEENGYYLMAYYGNDDYKKSFRRYITPEGKLIDKATGDLLNDDNYDDLNFAEGLVAARSVDTGLYGYLDHNGKEAIPFTFQSASQFKNGIAYVKKDGKFQIINRNGKILSHRDTQVTRFR